MDETFNSINWLDRLDRVMHVDSCQNTVGPYIGFHINVSWTDMVRLCAMLAMSIVGWTGLTATWHFIF